MSISLSGLSLQFERISIVTVLGVTALSAGCKLRPVSSDHNSQVLAIVEGQAQANYTSSDYPIEIRKILAKHETWLSVLVLNRLDMPAAVSKKWKVTADGDVASELTEVVKGSLTYTVTLTGGAPPVTTKYAWDKRQIELAQPLLPSSFGENWDFMGLVKRADGSSALQYMNDPEGRRVNATFKTYENDVIEVLVPVDGQPALGIVFLPSGQTTPTSVATVPDGFFTLPVTFYYSVKYSRPDAVIEPPPVTSYHHHDLQHRRMVAIDQDFPEDFLPSLRAALDAWNQALGVEYFAIIEARTDLTLAKCYAEDVLCIAWKGPAVLTAMGLGGIASQAVDPESGLVRGGVIVLQALSPASGSEAPSLGFGEVAPFPATIGTTEADVASIAKLASQLDQNMNKRHPYPLQLARWVILHEMGHYLGLTHNFAASAVADPGSITKSVMDYPPYAVRHLPKELGPWDVGIMAAVYKGMPMPTGYQSCDENGITPTVKGGFAFKSKPHCRRLDMGASHLWLMELAKNSPDGVFGEEFLSATLAAASSGLYPPAAVKSLKGNLLTELSLFLRDGAEVSPSVRQEVKGFLCGQPNLSSIKRQVAAEIGIDLGC
jgi:hypothetical protein